MFCPCEKVIHLKNECKGGPLIFFKVRIKYSDLRMLFDGETKSWPFHLPNIVYKLL